MATRKKSRSTRSKGSLKNRPGPNRTTDTKNSSDHARNATVSKSGSRSTVSGPAHRGESSAESARDALAAKFDSTQKLAADMPYNVNKALEHGELSMQPQEGQSTTPSDPSATGSTLTETNPSNKTGAGKPQLGSNPSSLPLDRVRVDSSGQTLTTNQGVPVADNQNSLKAGYRGPALLQDFILKRSPILTTSAYRSASSMPAVRRHMDISNATTRLHNIRLRRCSPRPASAHRSSYASRPSLENGGLPIQCAMCGVLLSSSIPTKAIGIWWATTFRFFSFRTP
jgi:hypothetical protein